MEEKIDMNLYPNRHGTTINVGLIMKRLGLCMPKVICIHAIYKAHIRDLLNCYTYFSFKTFNECGISVKG